MIVGYDIMKLRSKREGKLSVRLSSEVSATAEALAVDFPGVRDVADAASANLP